MAALASMITTTMDQAGPYSRSQTHLCGIVHISGVSLFTDSNQIADVENSRNHELCSTIIEYVIHSMVTCWMCTIPQTLSHGSV